MSGLLALIDQGGAPADHHRARSMLRLMNHRGPDGCDLVVGGAIAVGHQHHWTTPEEVGERQPATADDGRVLLALDGRLDNREELAAALGLDAASLAVTSDARLVLRAFERWGEGCFARLLGPFAVVIADPIGGTVLGARDPLGDRTLFYGGDHGLVVVASAEQVVLAHPALGRRLDDVSLAALFAVRARPPGRSFFHDVHELPQGHLLRIGEGRLEVHCYWRWRPTTLRLGDDRQYAEAFREALTTAVRCRLRAPARVGVLMSGGLDSTSVASVAARELGPGSGLPAVSWVFDELASCDERRYMDAVAAAWRLAPVRVPGDDAWPLRHASSWPYNPNRPVDNPYRVLKDRAYAAAHANGVAVLLTGGWGDHLYAGSGHWLREGLSSGRWWITARELAWRAAHGGLAPDRVARRFGAILHCRRPTGPSSGVPPWLTSDAAQLLEDDPGPHLELAGWLRPGQAALVCGALAADSAAAETFHAARHGLELRHPYRDRRLVELMLAMPADQLSRSGRHKWVLRVAMGGLLPDVVRLRGTPTSLVPLYQRGLLQRERTTLARLLSHPDALWRQFVHRDRLLAALEGAVAVGRDGPEGLVPWFGGYLELWHNLAAGASELPLAVA